MSCSLFYSASHSDSSLFSYSRTHLVCSTRSPEGQRQLVARDGFADEAQQLLQGEPVSLTYEARKLIYQPTGY